MARKTLKPAPHRSSHELVVITGLSGSGKGSVLKAFEDLGFYCVDNLPMDLMITFAELCAAPNSQIDRAAAVVDVREGQGLKRLPLMYQKLRRKGLKLSLVFLEASEDVLIRRFEETRRPHPLGRDLRVREGIRKERSLMKPMRRLADAVIDTTHMNVHELRDFVQERFGAKRARHTMLVCVLSFAYRKGVPHDADLMFDVRFLPNPNYDPRLKMKTGRDRAVRDFIDSFPETKEFLRHLEGMLLYLLPRYIREGKSYLTIAFGCTGGRHRSVAFAERMGSLLKEEGYRTRIIHRELGSAS
jgi:RNase adapter protein RapZ